MPWGSYLCRFLLPASSVIEELSNELKGHSDSKVPVTLNYGGKQHLVLFNFKCPSQFVFDADKRPISPRRIQLELKSIIVDNVIVQEIDGYSGEEFFLSIMGKTDPISKWMRRTLSVTLFSCKSFGNSSLRVKGIVFKVQKKAYWL